MFKKKARSAEEVDVNQLVAESDSGGRTPGPHVSRMILVVAVLWSLFPDYPYLLNAAHELTPELEHGGYVVKPIVGRGGANISIYDRHDGTFRHRGAPRRNIRHGAPQCRCQPIPFRSRGAPVPRATRRVLRIT